jgi:hypothetical protein
MINLNFEIQAGRHKLRSLGGRKNSKRAIGRR